MKKAAKMTTRGHSPRVCKGKHQYLQDTYLTGADCSEGDGDIVEKEKINQNGKRGRRAVAAAVVKSVDDDHVETKNNYGSKTEEQESLQNHYLMSLQGSAGTEVSACGHRE